MVLSSPFCAAVSRYFAVVLRPNGAVAFVEFGSLTTETLVPDPTPAVDATSPATAVSSAPAGEGSASVAPPSTTAGPAPSSADLLGGQWKAVV